LNYCAQQNAMPNYWRWRLGGQLGFVVAAIDLIARVGRSILFLQPFRELFYFAPLQRRATFPLISCPRICGRLTVPQTVKNFGGR
jgi:hypothetical protein